jgi:hypothetical protein
MAQDLVGAALGALRLSILVTVALFLPVFVQFLLLFVAGRFLHRLTSSSWDMYSFFGLIGTPVHELSHAAASLITLGGVRAVKLLSDQKNAGFVATRRSNPVQQVLTGMAPLLGCTLVLWLTATYVIPGFGSTPVSMPRLSLGSLTSAGKVLEQAVAYLGHFLESAFAALPDLQWGNWRTYVGLYIAFSTGAGLALSSADLKNLFQGLLWLFVMSWVVALLLYVLGDVEAKFVAVQDWLLPHLLSLSRATSYAFLLTALGVVALLPLGLLSRRGKNLTGLKDL